MKVPRNIVCVLRGLSLAVLVSYLPQGDAAAQQNAAQAQRALQTLSRGDIRRQILESGLTQQEIRERLRQAGYDPGLADRYFQDVPAGELGQTGPEDAQFLDVMRAIGLGLRIPVDTLGVSPYDSLRALLGRDSVSLDTLRVDTIGLQVFGRDVFQRRSTEFRPSVTGPVGPTYRLGPGDEVILILTGDVELAYRLDVTREGMLVIRDVGQVSVNGLTLASLEDLLYERLGRVYSGVRRGPSATTRFSVSLGQLRTSQVYVVGEAVRPGAYVVSSMATVLDALYAAGGPKETGSFRTISVRRGGELAGTFDLYRYLTAGETPVDLRLLEGDVVFVPPVGTQVALTGEVRRPAYYELIPGEGLEEVVRYAGGLRPGARTDHVEVERILHMEEREPGRDRVVLDADYAAVRTGGAMFPLVAGDSIHVASVIDERRDWVEIDGAVYHPGRYQLQPGETAATLIERAGGTLPDVLDIAVHVARKNLSDGSRVLLRTSLQGAATLPLMEFDEVTLFGRESLRYPDSVGVFGYVQRPGRYRLVEGTTAEDVILLAGGLTYGADPRQAEVVRLVVRPGDGDHISTSWIVRLSPGIPQPGPIPSDSLPPPDSELPPAEALPLSPGDEVYVRQIAEYRPPRHVDLVGEFRRPGTYVLRTVDERLTSVVRRAGDLTTQAFPQGFRLIRDGITVGVDLERALREPGGPDDPVLAEGDRLVVPIYDATVVVAGAVVFDTRVVFRRGMDLGDALSAAGGVRPEADKGRISVEYANGSRSTVKRFLGMTYSSPDIRPGSRVFVPEQAETEGGFDWDQALTRILAVASTLATVVIATR